jgi:Raf kinase inhibitor-like YbhB/YbcL family protein
MITLLIYLAALFVYPESYLAIKSPAFENQGNIPSKYTCEGDNVNPEIDVRNMPASAKSLVLIMEDPDATKGTFDHWIMWNIPVDGVINENSAPGVQGKNGAGQNKYTGPCPPTGNHRYLFKLYALDQMLDLKEGATKKALQEAMKGHILSSGELIGHYQKTNTAKTNTTK